MSADLRPSTPHSTTTAAVGETRDGLAAELRVAVRPRHVLLVLGVLALQLGFIASYVGAFHNPRPWHIRVAVVAPAQLSASAIATLNSVPSSPLRASPTATVTQARQQIQHGDVAGALILTPAGPTDRLLIASARGPAEAAALKETLTRLEASQRRGLTVTDTAPLQAGDGRGLSGFYAVIGWLVGGYLLAAILGVTVGTRPGTPRRAAIRLAAMLPYALASGLGGAILLDPVLGALTGHFWDLAAVGTGLVLSAATITLALEALFGVVGIGITVLIFVVLGNPSAGGPYQAPLLPPFWRAIGGLFPNGAGTEAVRDLVYFDGHAAATAIATIATWAIAGALLTMLASARHPRTVTRAAATAA